jgi:carbonic anhydrase/acetyltransferase-like protein (isoleucine patch superfamily)
MGAPLNIAANVTVDHQAMQHGCSVGAGSLIGIKAVILNHAVIGANALVTEGKVIPDNSLVLGSPGKILRSLTDVSMHANTAHHAENAAHYIAELEALN